MEETNIKHATPEELEDFFKDGKRSDFIGGTVAQKDRYSNDKEEDI